MKKILLTVFTLTGILTTSVAQINGGFETWGATAQQPEEPTGWITANLFASPLITFPNPNPNPTSATKLLPPNAYMGNFSMKMVTVVLVQNPDPQNIPDTLGAAITGSVVISLPNFTMYDRVPYTARPATLFFNAKYMPNGVDTASVYMELTKWNGASRDIIQSVWVPIIPSTTWNNYVIPLNTSYLLATIPDSMSVGVTASSYYAPRPGSEVHIDNIGFNGWVGMNDQLTESPVTVYPNPTAGSLSIDASALGADLLSLEIYDLNGKLVMMHDMRNASALTIDVNALAAGTYTYLLRSTTGISFGDGKFIKE